MNGLAREGSREMSALVSCRRRESGRRSFTELLRRSVRARFDTHAAVRGLTALLDLDAAVALNG
jgi:hypothetical protein